MWTNWYIFKRNWSDKGTVIEFYESGYFWEPKLKSKRKCILPQIKNTMKTTNYGIQIALYRTGDSQKLFIFLVWYTFPACVRTDSIGLERLSKVKAMIWNQDVRVLGCICNWQLQWPFEDGVQNKFICKINIWCTIRSLNRTFQLRTVDTENLITENDEYFVNAKRTSLSWV